MWHSCPSYCIQCLVNFTAQVGAYLFGWTSYTMFVRVPSDHTKNLIETLRLNFRNNHQCLIAVNDLSLSLQLPDRFLCINSILKWLYNIFWNFAIHDINIPKYWFFSFNLENLWQLLFIVTQLYLIWQYFRAFDAEEGG